MSAGGADDIFADDRVKHLYSVPIERFVAERDAISRDLKAEGRTAEAAAVHALRRPTVAAWAINQVRRQDPELIDELIGAGSELQQAQRALLAGGGSAHLQEAARAEREAVERATEAARAVLAEAGRPASGQTLDRVRETLHAAALDEGTRRQLEEGRLTEEHTAVGLGPMAPAPGVGARVRKQGRERERKRERRDEQRARSRELTAAEAELEQAQARAARAERALRDAQTQLEAAQRRVDELSD